MHLAIDLRFYSPEPFGISVHIRDLFNDMVPVLQELQDFNKISLIFSHKIKQTDVANHLKWWSSIENNPKFQIIYSTSKYYSIEEQTVFLSELNRLNPDLTYFFSFNFPILYNRPFVYQVLDLSIPKTRSQLNLKVQAMLLCFRTGVAKAKHILFLGENSKSDAAKFCNYNFKDQNNLKYRPNTVIYNGLDNTYITYPTANEQKNQLKFTEQESVTSQKLLSELKVTKPYFLFVSIWRKYKNVELLVEAFEKLQAIHDDKYQLVLGGSPDPNYPEALKRVENSLQFKNGNIIIAKKLPTPDLIRLHDQALGLVSPSASEGFGLPLVEAAARFNPVLCSDIPIYHEVLNDTDALFFDPTSADSLFNALETLIKMTPEQKIQMTQQAYQNTLKFRWSNTAQTIVKVLTDVANQLNN